MSASPPPVPTPQLGSREGWFEALRPFAYLNHAAVSPHSAPLRAAVTRCMDAYASEGIGGFGGTLARRTALRGRLAALLDAGADEVAFVPNTTTGVISVAQSIAWKPGDRVVLFRGEFPANTTPWQQAALQYGLRLEWLDLADFDASNEAGLAALDEALRVGVRLVAVSAVQFKSGLQMPLAEMARRCHERGAELFVDAIQGFGATPISTTMGFDYLAAGGHKWLMGVEGAGLLYVRRERMSQLLPRLAGWLGHEHAFDFLVRGPGHLRYDAAFRRDAEVFEPGTQNVLGYEALGVGIIPAETLGVAAIHAHVNAYLDALERGLLALGFRSLRAPEAARRSTILSVETPAGLDPVRLHGELSARSVVCGLPDGVLRFSPHFYNHVSEVQGVLDATHDALTHLQALPRS
ncbi:MAG: aminotransferase class V-fold PLP-dependent enzyme [Myxococcales bacterium]|nr:aminotransferase class V-fold PLP-dependent enzyme [Myxococcales bacterium]MCB9627719.1 aminotransferase class V-fold PLP-dependent enzyme [Sandaracinaceae bacterium]